MEAAPMKSVTTTKNSGEKMRQTCKIMDTEIKSYLSAIGRRGGKAGTGKAKARTKEQARKAAMARWVKRKTITEIFFCDVCGKTSELETGKRHYCDCNPTAPFYMYSKRHREITKKVTYFLSTEK